MAAATRFEALDAWRGISALLVALFHFCFVMASRLFEFRLVLNAYLFVDFFFVLSGFVVRHAYGERLNDGTQWASFVIRRLGRLWPLHLSVLALFVLAILAINLFLPHPSSLTLTLKGGEYSVVGVVQNVLLLTAMNLGLSWNTPSWSIGAEFYTYLLFGIACLMLAIRRIALGAATLVAASLLALYVLAPTYINTTGDFGLIRCVAGFFTGIVAYHLFRRLSGRPLPLPTLAEALAVAAVGLFVVAASRGPDEVHAWSLAAPLVFAMAVMVFALEQGRISQWLRLPPFRALGRYSYSIYMVHQLVLVLMGYGVWLYGEFLARPVSVQTYLEGREKHIYDLGSPLAMDALLAAFVGLVIACAMLTYRFVEEPGRRLFARLAARVEERRAAG